MASQSHVCRYRSVWILKTFDDIIHYILDWSNSFVGEVSRYIDVDSPDPILAKKYHVQLLQELDYAMYLAIPAVIIHLHSGNCENLARVLLKWLHANNPHVMIWIQVPLLNKTAAMNEQCDEKNPEELETTWEW